MKHTNDTDQLVVAKGDSWQMFDDISPKYDLLNRLLSFGLDGRWRKQLSSHLPNKPAIHVLDLATGTADVLLSFVKQRDNIVKANGTDLAVKMLDIGREKIRKLGLGSTIELQKGDAMDIPFADNSFDAVSISFGIRNLTDPSKALNEMHRVLRKDGRALVLEFSLPRNPLLKVLHLFYLRNFIPLVGKIVSGHDKAYRYLNQTIEDFPYGQDFGKLMEDAGFKSVEIHPLLFGVVSIYRGDKK